LAHNTAAALVIINFVAIFGQFGLWLPLAILKTVQDYLNALFVQGFNLVENDNNAAIVGRIRDIERNDV
jgi:hypothetical protein